MKPFDRLVVRLVAVALAAGVGAAVIGTGLLASSGRATLREDIKNQHETVAGELASRVDARIDAVLSTLRVVATRPTVGDLRPAAAGELAAVLRASDRFDELVLRDGSGRAVAAAAARFLAEPGDYADDPAVVSATAERDAVRLLDVDAGVVEIAVRVENPPGIAVGVLVARAPLEVVLQGVFRAPTRTEPTRYLVDRSGNILVHPDRDRVVGRDAVDLSALGGLPAAGVVAEQGLALLRGAAPIGRFDGIVVVEQAEEVALAPVDQRTRDLVEILVAVIGSAVLAISVVGGYLLRPLRPLAASIAQLGHGGRGVRIEARGGGEIAALGEEFNRLADALEGREREVAELQRVSLLLHRHAAQSDLLADVVAGASAVLEASDAELWEIREEDFSVVTGGGRLADRAKAREVVAEAVRTASSRSVDGDPATAAFPIVAADGEVSAVIVVSRPQSWDTRSLQMGDALAAVAGVAIENVRRLELERELAEELQTAADRRRDFMGTVTHEFRTPLTCIEGFSSLLLEQWDAQSDSERRLFVEKIHRHSEELDELVSRLLDFAVTERGTLVADLMAVELAPLVEEVLAQLAPLLRGRSVNCEVEPVVVEADPTLLRRTLTNLVANAVKYSHPGTPITIRSHPMGVTVRVEIEDRGIGMTPEEVERAFTPFWRAGNPSTRAARGAGIGLSLVSEYVRSMGGRVEVRSEPGEGSTFSFTLARATAS